MPAPSPNPAPPPGKPKIGVAWISVAIIFALIMATWLYFATRGARPETQQRPAAENESTVP